MALPVECTEIVQYIKYNFHFLSSNKIQKAERKRISAFIIDGTVIQIGSFISLTVLNKLVSVSAVING
ncbi:MAG TPA: hypothetical protein VJ697_14345 [Nitrososphaeraceae archaeon]|nr:hypothetical protein [Nitrososphaeraceae archaeon]